MAEHVTGVRVGSGYITINPRMDQDQLARQLAKFEEAVKATYKRQSDVTRAYARLQVQLEAWVTERYGEQAKARLAVHAETIKARKQLSRSEAAVLLQALAEVEKAEQAQIRRVAAARREAQQAAVRGARVEAAETAAAAKSAQTAHTRTFQQVKAQLLEQMQLERMRERARLEGELAVQTASARTAASQLANARSSLAQLSSLTRGTATVAKNFKVAGTSIERVGTTASELGRTLMTSVVTPLAAAGTGLTAWGLKAADNFQATQTSLRTMGLALKDANDLMHDLTSYGLKTPYSIGDMLTYGTRIARAAGAHNSDFTSSDPKRHATGSREVSHEAQNIVQMIGDLAARGGITDSSMVQRGYYAMEKLMDADRVSLRDTKQLEYAINMPVQELAQLLGFTDSKYTARQVKDFQAVNPGFHAKAGDIYPASAQMMEVMSKAKQTGGVRGQDMVHGLLGYWEGKSNVPGAKPDKTIQGSAERLGTATFSSRVSNMKETAQQNLRGMVQRFNPKTGELEYTGLGASIMGKRVQVKGKDGKVHNEWRGGLLNEVAGVGGDLMGKHGDGAVPQLMGATVEGLSTAVGWVKAFAGELEEHPEAVKVAAEVGKLAAVVAPVALALGAMGKIVGKFVKLMSPVLTGVKLVGKGLLGGGKIAGQVARGLQSKASGGSYRSGYRAQRGVYNDGDTRSLGRRTVDRARGRNSQEETLRLNATQYEEAMRAAQLAADALKRKIAELNRGDLSKVAGEVAGKDSSVQAAAAKAERATDKAAKAVRNLNREKLNALREQVTGSTSKANAFVSASGKASSAVKTLNGKSLKALKGQFKDVSDAADKAIRKASTLTGEVETLNSKNLNGVTREVKALKDALSKTNEKAVALTLSLDHIENHRGTSGGSGKKPRRPKKNAKGGVMPGYAPGVDSIPAVLSPGESVLRPEVTHALGPERINYWNSLAVRGRLVRRFAQGGIVGRLGLNDLVNAAKNYNIGSDVLSATSTMEMDSSSRTLGGGIQQGVLGAGTEGSHFVGSDLAGRFRGIYDFITKDSWQILRKLPIPDGWTQAIGVLGGALTPLSGEYFWDDVWKGRGNVLERGGAYLDDLFSWQTLKGVVSNLLGGAWESAKSLFKGGTALLTDPVGTVKDSIGALWDLGVAEYDGLTDMVKSLRSIWTSPLDYASQVVGDIYSTAQESLPNLDGLFDFSGHDVSAVKPDVADKIAGLISEPGSGDAVQRWAPQVKMALAQLGLAPSSLDLVLHRIGVESGGNPNVVNNWDSNAKAGFPSQGLMQTIPQTFNAYAGPYLSRGILDPMANIYAGVNYAVHRYGKGWKKALSGTKGYATGTDGAARGWAWVGEAGPELINFSGGETVLNHTDSMLASASAPVRRGYAVGTGSRTTGLAHDAEQGVSSLNAAIKKLYAVISKGVTSGQISPGTASGLNRWLDKENKDLQKLVKQRAGLTSQLKDANGKLAAVRQDEAEMASSISDQAKTGRSLTAVFSSNGVSAGGALSSLHSQLAGVKQLQADAEALVKRGYSQEIVAEVAQAGPEQGHAMARELLASTASQVQDFNSTYAGIGSSSDALGKSVSKSYYAAGEKAAQALVDGLTAKDKKLVKRIEGLADTIRKTLLKKLHVNANTPVNIGLAQLLTWLTGDSQAVKGKTPASKKASKRVTTSHSKDAKGRKVTTVTTTTTDPVTHTTTVHTERTVGGKTTTSTRVTQTKGYTKGVMSASPGLALVGERGPELLDSRGGKRGQDARTAASTLNGPRYEIHVHEAQAENTTQSVLRAMQYAEVMYGT